jgi:dihydrofolate reductase
MRKVILKMSVSVDGFVCGPNGEIDWIFRSNDEGATAWTVETLWQAGLHIMGSRTYQDMAAYWPTSTEPFAPPMNEIPKAVFSKDVSFKPNAALTTTALTHARARADAVLASSPPSASAEASWANPTIASGDLAEDIARLKRQPGKSILAHGGAGFARSLVGMGLVDEYRLLTHPVLLGRGRPLFADLPRPVDLELLATTVFPTGAIARVFRARA